ncbi:MAG: hypothetical protein KAX19_02405 [Candidatus Brocadiae bacterium]|nr:hypothetical protein [Candidatus Brocadiia bacterium]
MGETEDRCLCCGGKIETFPDQDGSCDYQCLHCGWSEHVPSRGKGHGLSAAISPRAVALARVDPVLLEQQAAILGKIVEKHLLTDSERSCLEGLWELVHTLLDSIESENALREREGGGTAGSGAAEEGQGPQRKPIDELRDHAIELVNEMAELAQQVEGKVATHTGSELGDPPICQESREVPVGHFPQLASYLQTISDYIVCIRRSIEQL